MRITFVLPGIALEPNGGTKIVYEYANRLAERGHSCCVMHPRTWDKLAGPVQAVKARIWPAYIRLRHGGPTPWLMLHHGVSQRLAPDLSPTWFPDADVVVATFFRTAPFVNALPAAKGNKFYLVQHYEVWAGSKEEVDATWKLPMHKIVISKWLQGIAAEFGEQQRTSHIPNGMDLGTLRVTQPIEKRGQTITMLTNPNKFKGTADGLAAIELIKQEIPDLRVNCFGTSERDAALPAWIEYKRLPTTAELVELYNSASIFLQPSHAEGWGLTSTEAMACGCALVSTDNGGSRDFAVPGETAVVVRVGDTQAMAAEAIDLLKNDKRRIELARRGEQYVQQFNWERAITSMEAAFTGTGL